MNEFLFSYGTLQKEEVQRRLFGRILASSADILKGYKISAIEITDEKFLSNGEGKYQKALIVSKDKIDIVRGLALEISRKELLIADKYEPANYQRVEVTLDSGRKAWVYVANEK